MTKPSFPSHPDGETMKAVCFTSFGKDPNALSVQTIPKPFVSEPEEILIKIHAASLNPIDKVRVAGELAMMSPEPYNQGVLGYDASGVVEKIGGDGTSSAFQIGDEVYVRPSKIIKYGAVAEYIVCAESEIAKKPSNITHSEAASIPLAGVTALQALRRGGAKEGSKVFISGGAGGVGSLAIQIAKKILKVSYVCTTASPGIGTDICTKAGADRIIDYRSENFEQVLKGEGFDVAFDTTNESHKMGGDLLKKGGKIVTIAGMPPIESIEEWVEKPSMMIRIFAFLMRNRAAERAAAKAEGTWEWVLLKPNGKDLTELATFIEKGDIIPFIDTEAKSLDDFKVAVDKLWSGRSKGKCVIKVA